MLTIFLFQEAANRNMMALMKTGNKGI